MVAKLERQKRTFRRDGKDGIGRELEQQVPVIVSASRGGEQVSEDRKSKSHQIFSEFFKSLISAQGCRNLSGVLASKRSSKTAKPSCSAVDDGRRCLDFAIFAAFFVTIWGNSGWRDLSFRVDSSGFKAIVSRWQRRKFASKSYVIILENESSRDRGVIKVVYAAISSFGS